MAGLAGEFDPYHKWLGIPPRDQPPNHYRLLGLQIFETDEEVIEMAASRLIAFCEQHSHGPHAADSRRVVFEIAAARLCLLDPAKRLEYDQQLNSSTAGSTPKAVARNPAVRSAGVERRVVAPPAPPPPRPTVAPAAPRPAKPLVSAPQVIVAEQTPTVDEVNPFSINVGGGAAAGRGRKSSGASKTAHQSSSAELDEMLSGLAIQTPPVAPTTKVVPSVTVQPSASGRVGAVKPTQAAKPRAADAGELSSLFGEPAPPPVVVTSHVPPAAPTEEVEDIFGLLSAEPAPSAAKRSRGGRAKATPTTTAEPSDTKGDKKSGKKKKNSQALLIVGGMGAIAVLLMVVGAFLLLGGDSKPKAVAKNGTESKENDEESEENEEQASDKKSDDADKASTEKPNSRDDDPVEKVPKATETAKTDIVDKDETEEEPAPASAKKAASDALLELCTRGGSDLQIKKLLSSGADLEVVDLSRRTPLRLAVMGKHVLLVKALIAAKAEVNALDSRGESAIMSAVQNGDEKLVAVLLEAKADPNLATIGKNGKGTGTTPLHIAARQGHTEVAMLLVEHAARLDVQNREGVTPLMVAAWQGHSETALALLARGADVKSTVDAEGQSPLMYAAHGGKLDIVEAMLNKGAVAGHKSATGVTALSIALGSPERNLEVISKLRRVASDEAPALDF